MEKETTMAFIRRRLSDDSVRIAELSRLAEVNYFTIRNIKFSLVKSCHADRADKIAHALRTHFPEVRG